MIGALFSRFLKIKKGLRPIEGRLYLLNSDGMMKPILEQSLFPYQGKVLLWSTYRSSLPLSIDRVTFTSFPRTGLLLERKYLSTLLVEEEPRIWQKNCVHRLSTRDRAKEANLRGW